MVPGRRYPCFFSHRMSILCWLSVVVFESHLYQLPEPEPPILYLLVIFLSKSLGKCSFFVIAIPPKSPFLNYLFDRKVLLEYEIFSNGARAGAIGRYHRPGWTNPLGCPCPGACFFSVSITEQVSTAFFRCLFCLCFRTAFFLPHPHPPQAGLPSRTRGNQSCLSKLRHNYP